MLLGKDDSKGKQASVRVKRSSGSMYSRLDGSGLIGVSGDVVGGCHICSGQMGNTFHEFVRWNGEIKYVCTFCHVAVVEGYAVYSQKYPNWKPPMKVIS